MKTISKRVHPDKNQLFKTAARGLLCGLFVLHLGIFQFRLCFRRVLPDISNRLHKHREAAHRVSRQKFNAQVAPATDFQPVSNNTFVITPDQPGINAGVSLTLMTDTRVSRFTLTITSHRFLCALATSSTMLVLHSRTPELAPRSSHTARSRQVCSAGVCR